MKGELVTGGATIEDPLLTDQQGTYKTYPSRWFMLVIFSILSITNAMMWITFAPISDDASDYFGGIGITAVNFLAIVFQIGYGPGTLLGIIAMKKYDLRGTLLIGGTLTFIGSLLRVAAALLKNRIGNYGCYSLMLIGQMLASLAGPMYNSLPPALAAAWFSISERDIATAVGSLFNPLGNAAGQILPPLFVSETDDGTVQGFIPLMIVESVLIGLSLLLALVFFKSAPPSPPSYSTHLRNAGIDIYSSIDSGDEQGGWIRLKKEYNKLMQNKDYVILLVSFSLGLALFNTFLTLIYQIIEPWGYSNNAAGTFGAVLIVCGLLGAASAGALLETTRWYRTILKWGFFLCHICLLFFFLMLYSDNFSGLLAAFCLLGFFMLPMLPAVVENCAECTYPLPEELSIGLLFFGGNIVGIPCIFIVQVLLSKRIEDLPPPFLPSNLFIEVIFIVTLCVLFFYHGDYKRMNCDKVPEENRSDTMMFCDESPSLNASMTARGLRKAGSLGSTDHSIFSPSSLIGMVTKQAIFPPPEVE